MELAGDMKSFQRIVDTHGTVEDKKRLAALGVGYHYCPILTTLSTEDRDFLRSVGIKVEKD
jgi:hypothetical protein